MAQASEVACASCGAVKGIAAQDGKDHSRDGCLDQDLEVASPAGLSGPCPRPDSAG